MKATHGLTLGRLLADQHFSAHAEHIEALGFEQDVMSWNISRCSSGEKQRLSILRMMANCPRVLLLDEPTASLDPDTGDWIRTSDIEGVVIDVNWRTSRIRDRNGDMTIVPNSQLASSPIGSCHVSRRNRVRLWPLAREARTRNSSRSSASSS